MGQTTDGARPSKVNWVVISGVATVAAAIIGLLAWLIPRSPDDPLAASGSPGEGTTQVDTASPPTPEEEPSTQIVTTTTTTAAPRQWLEGYKSQIIDVRDSVYIDLDTPDAPTVKTEDFPGSDLEVSEYGGDVYTEEPVVMSVHDGPNATLESCTKSLQVGPMTKTWLRVDEPYLCVRTDMESIAFLTVVEDIGSYRANVNLWRLG